MRLSRSRDEAAMLTSAGHSTAVLDRMYAARRGVGEGQGGHLCSQRGGEHCGYKRDGVARHRAIFAGQVGGVEIDAGDRTRTGGVSSQ
jgi:hypothetical protein